MPKLLIVDDEVEIRALMSDVAQAVGCEADVVEDGGAALARFQPGLYDAVITDFLMPGITGLEVARTIRRREPQVTIIMMTGSRLPVNDAFEEFGLLVLTKPFSLQHLEEAVATAVAKTRWAREGSTGPDV